MTRSRLPLREWQHLLPCCAGGLLPRRNPSDVQLTVTPGHGEGVAAHVNDCRHWRGFLRV